jgi:hypothetical protein
MTLIKRLEKAAEGSSELDLAIAEVVGWAAEYRQHIADNIRKNIGYFPIEDMCPEYTQSLDAALMLVPEGWMVRLESDEHHREWWAELSRRSTLVTGEAGPNLGSPTPALALVIACLRARAVQ